MATDPALLAHVLDLFSGLGRIGSGRLFGGTALYLSGDVMFAAIIDDTVYMKSDAGTADAFAAAGSEPFSYRRAGTTARITSLMRLPESAMDDAEEALHWARLSLPPAEAAAARKRRDKDRRSARRAARAG